ncbi:hypothetical protein [Actinomadura madurae]|uniref:hypothetical protein n=1 Tax=Actinomadura madurae TaxID=1993 RepID=UPI0020D21CA2|nr:hypothetical protein [Actinomadura madurae]MCP9985084.1 hypothetical protein [Actinomadura madurae]MCQ0021301.1 hypothetical protein [Actinomadura madurae]
MPEPIARVNYGAHQFAAHLGLTRWQLRVGLEHEILPGPDLAGERWSAGLADQARERVEEVLTRFGTEPPVGSGRAAARLAARVGLDVERRDIEVLVAQGTSTSSAASAASPSTCSATWTGSTPTPSGRSSGRGRDR